MPQPGYAEPKTLQHLASKDAILFNANRAKCSILAQFLELSLLAHRIDQPILAHATLLVFVELLPAVPRAAARTDDFYDQIGWAFQVVSSELAESFPRDED